MTIFQQYRQYLANYNVSIVAVQGMVQKYDRFAKLVNVSVLCYVVLLLITCSSLKWPNNKALD